MALDFSQVRRDLNTFDFSELFRETLGWSAPPNRRGETLEADSVTFTLTQIAELGGVVVLEATAPGEELPDAKTRRALHKQVGERYLENLLIFVDEARTRSLWEYAKREGGKTVYRPHPFVRGQPGDLFIGKLSGIIFDVKDFDADGNVSVIEVAARLRNALDVEQTTKKFYVEYQAQHLEFVELIKGIPDDRQRRWYASVLLNRLMFVYFLQRKSFVDKGNLNYLNDKLNLIQGEGKNYYTDFLRPLFFEGFAKPAEHRTPEARVLLGEIKYLNGGLFLEHTIEQNNPNIAIPNEAFENLLHLFSRYSWNLNDLPGKDDRYINPDVLGYIFEKYINQKAFGAYYTRPEITEYLCEQTINRLILEAVNVPQVVPGLPRRKHFDSVADLLMNLDAPLCKQLLEILPKLSLLDPACGSGAFLVAALNTLRSIYEIVWTRTLVLRDDYLREAFEKIQREHPSLTYYIKKRIITDNLYGVDLMEEATDIAKLQALSGAGSVGGQGDAARAPAQHRLQHHARKLTCRANARRPERVRQTRFGRFGDAVPFRQPLRTHRERGQPPHRGLQTHRPLRRKPVGSPRGDSHPQTRGERDAGRPAVRQVQGPKNPVRGRHLGRRQEQGGPTPKTPAEHRRR